MKVLQLIDTLNAGGAERVAVNYANLLADKLEGSFLCTTRKEGVLKKEINQKVGYLFLNKKHTLDLKAVFELKKFVAAHQIDLIHAHATSFFTAVLVKIFYPRIKVVWHDHYGKGEYLNSRPHRVLRVCKYFFDKILTVSRRLEEWNRTKIRHPRVAFFPNFSILNYQLKQTRLKGENTIKIICTANLRSQKNQLLLLEAFGQVAENRLNLSLHLLGRGFEDDYQQKVSRKIDELTARGLKVYWYGGVPDVAHVLSQANIAVLPSDSEGFPLTLVEYGQMGLPVIATNVGACAEILGSPPCGILIPPQQPGELAKALSLLLDQPEKAKEMGQQLQNRVRTHYLPDTLINQLVQCYETL